MKITHVSMFTGKENTLELPITQAQYDLWKSGELIQNAFPNLNANQREFLMTGAVDDEWDQAFPDEDK